MLATEDRLALDGIEGSETERVVEALVEILSSQPVGNEAYRRAFAIYVALGDPNMRLGVARALVGTFPKDEYDPYAAYLAALGTDRDIPVLLQQIRRSPDGEGIAIAEILAERSLPRLTRDLGALSLEAPGKWEEMYDIKRGLPKGTLRQDFLLLNPLQQQVPQKQESE